jgi:GDP-L-fucose synthase
MNKAFWQNKRVLVTGGTGFLGNHLVRAIRKLQPKKLRVPTSKTHDLRQQSACAKVVKDIDIVIHLAANVGGIGYNQQFPGTLFYDNLVMGVHLMEEARLAGVKKFVSLGTICSYPKYTQVPFKEEALWEGYPEETNAPYGLAKKMLLTQGEAYHQQYGFNAIYLLQVNLYGPGDNFDPRSSHVVPALIRKFIEARNTNQPTVEIWGTGKPTREFLFVEDAVRGIILATEKYNKPDPVNLGASFEISIKELATLIMKLTGYQGKIVFNTSKPDGQPRRKLDVTRAKKEFGFEAEIKFAEGLKKTIGWYEKNN